MLSRWNTNGTVSWSKWISIDGTQNNDTTKVKVHSGFGGVDSSNNVYFLLVELVGTRGAYILKFNSSGTLQWQKNIPLISQSIILSIMESEVSKRVVICIVVL